MKRYLTIALPVFALANVAYAQVTPATLVDLNCAIHGVPALPGRSY